MSQIDYISLTLKEAMQLPDLVRGKGIYFLWRSEELLYIGASTNAVDRINRQSYFRDFGHLGSPISQLKKRIPFNKSSILKWEGTVEDMAAAEAWLIKRWDPPYNDATDEGAIRWSDVIANERRGNQ